MRNISTIYDLVLHMVDCFRNELIIHVSGCISGAGCLGGLNPELYKSTPETEDDEVDYPANHFGRVWYALEYEMMSERLLVTLIKARNLSEARSHGGSSAASSSLSPFVRITLFPDERRTLQTKPKKATRNPQFNETFGFQVRPIYSSLSRLLLA